MLRKSKASASGNKVLQPVEYAEASAKGFYSGYDVLDTSPSEVFSDASYEWKQAYSTISISGKEEALNDGKERVIDLLEAKVKNAEKSIKKMFGAKLYSSANGSSDEGFMGLQHVCAVDRSMGAIDSTTHTWWDGYVSARANTPTYANLIDSTNANYIQKIFREVFGALTIGSDKPSLIMVSQVVFDAYEESLTQQKRFGASDKSLADSGFSNLLYRGVPVVVDSELEESASGKMFMINEKYLQFRHHRKRNFSFEGFQKPINQDARVAKVLWLGALTCSNPRMQGMLSSLPTSYS
jgi:hypothetical protein